MARECYHCQRWIEDGEEHDCWTTTEAALTRDLSEELRDAYERLTGEPFAAYRSRTGAPERDDDDALERLREERS